MVLRRFVIALALLLVERSAHAEGAPSAIHPQSAKATATTQPYEPATAVNAADPWSNQASNPALPRWALSKPMDEKVDWEAHNWFLAVLMGDLGGMVAGAGGGLLGAAIGGATCDRQSDDGWDCLGSVVGGLLIGGLVGWTVGVPAGVTLYGRRTELRDGGYGAALLGGLAGTLASAALFGVLISVDANSELAQLGTLSLLVLPSLGAAMGYSRSASHSLPSPPLSLIHYDERLGFRMGAPAITISHRNGERTTMVRLLGGSF